MGKEKLLVVGEEKWYNYMRCKNQMTKRTYVTKSGDTYEWEETKETVAALKELNKFSGNYPGPLYAPHPRVKDNGKSA